MSIENRQKEEIANRLLDGILGPSHGKVPDHYHQGRTGVVNDSHLCKVGNNFICVKSVDRGGISPCIGFYIKEPTKKEWFERIKQLPLPDGFSLDEKAYTKKPKGWISFGREECKSADDLYKQIVNPGTKLEQWVQLFNTLKSFAEEEFGYAPEFFDKANKNKENEKETPQMPTDSTEEQKKSKGMDSRNLIVFGAPGAGKSHKLEADRKSYFDDRFERVTFYPTYSYAQFVGTYKPVMKPKENGGGEEISYEFVPGPFLRVLVKALNAQADDNGEKQKYCLVIEEINRANAAAVFGDIFQLLDRGEDESSEYSIAASEDVKKYLKGKLNDEAQKFLNVVKKKDQKGNEIEEWEFCNLRIPANMYIWATMNSADQGVFPMDTAFKRRWEFEYIGIDEGEGDCKNWTIEGSDYKWNDVRKFINALLASHGVNEDKLMGPFFVKAQNDVVSKKAFKSKVLMYLWEDAARMCRRQMFGKDILTYSVLCECWDKSGVGAFKEDSELGKSDDNSDLKKLYRALEKSQKHSEKTGAGVSGSENTTGENSQ